MLRSEVINRLLALFDRPSYLEIGVNTGETFQAVQAEHKVAVDPVFAFDWRAHAVAKKVMFHEVTSDAYFSVSSDVVFDVIYLDGLHTFEQTLRDLMNAVAVLRPGGCIVIDDVLPNSFDASLPDFAEIVAIRGATTGLDVNWHSDGSWMGDVFKLIFFIESFILPFSYATVAENHGQTVLWRGMRDPSTVRFRSVEAISRLDYRHTILDRSVFNIRPFAEIVGHVGQGRAVPQVQTRATRRSGP